MKYDRMTRDDLQMLVKHPSPPCVSLCLATSPIPENAREVQLRLKGMIRTAEERLPDSTARELLEPVRNLERLADFWSSLGRGLAVYSAAGYFRVIKLPDAVPDRIEIGDAFLVRPLAPFVTENTQFRILSVSKDQARIVECHRYGCEAEHDLDVSLAKTLRYDDGEETLQQHTGTPAPAGNTQAMFHGQGSGQDVREEHLVRYLRDVAKAAEEHLRDFTGPVVFAGSDQAFGHLAGELGQVRLQDVHMAGNHDGLPLAELHEKALHIAQNAFTSETSQMVERFHDARPQGLASADAGEVLRAAATGSVETLLLATDADLRGTYDQATGKAIFGDGSGLSDTDLLNAAAVETLRHGGNVVTLDAGSMPDKAPMAAIFRFVSGV